MNLLNERSMSCRIKIGIEVFPLPTVSDVEAVAALLKRFLGLEEMQHRRQQEEEAESGEEEEDSFDYSSDSGDEDMNSEFTVTDSAPVTLCGLTKET